MLLALNLIVYLFAFTPLLWVQARAEQVSSHPQPNAGVFAPR